MAALYSEVILDHYRHPRNYRSLPAPDIMHEDFNPLCGDRIRIELALEDDVVAAAGFKGDGCAISIAAASVLTDMIAGKSLGEVGAILNDSLLAELRSDIQPARMQCALLPLDALRYGLQGYLKQRARN